MLLSKCLRVLESELQLVSIKDCVPCYRYLCSAVPFSVKLENSLLEFSHLLFPSLFFCVHFQIRLFCTLHYITLKALLVLDIILPVLNDNDDYVSVVL